MLLNDILQLVVLIDNYTTLFVVMFPAIYTTNRDSYVNYTFIVRLNSVHWSPCSSPSFSSSDLPNYPKTHSTRHQPNHIHTPKHMGG